jgi:hypothetical protein
MQPDEFAQACRAITRDHRGHDAHRRLDSLVTRLLNGLGYGEGMAIFVREVTPYHEELINRIEQFMAVTGMTATRFGRLAVGDPGLVRDLRNGRRPLEWNTRRILAFMEATP